MELTARYIITRIFDHLRMVRELEEVILKTNNPGKQNSLRKDRMMKIGKVKGDLTKLNRMVNGTIQVVKFSDNGEIYERHYVNLSSDDIAALFRLERYLHGHDLRILEIRNINTKDSIRKL